jgi:hypothetical protein
LAKATFGFHLNVSILALSSLIAIANKMIDTIIPPSNKGGGFHLTTDGAFWYFCIVS